MEQFRKNVVCRCFHLKELKFVVWKRVKIDKYRPSEQPIKSDESGKTIGDPSLTFCCCVPEAVVTMTSVRPWYFGMTTINRELADVPEITSFPRNPM